MEYRDVIRHYTRHEVRQEIARFARSRWVALHCMVKTKKDSLTMVRFDAGRPLTIEKSGDIGVIFLKFSKLLPRTIYASANVYRRLRYSEDVYDPQNIVGCTPTWDIDVRDQGKKGWIAALKAAYELVCFLDKWGVRESVFVKVSGRGLHVHIHHEAISEDVRTKYHPLDVAYAIVEFGVRRLESQIRRMGLEEGVLVKIENCMDKQRVFTCPLSLHRELDVVCVCINPDTLPDVDYRITDPEGFVHYRDWNRYDKGECDELAYAALNAVGGYPWPRRTRRRKHPPIEEQILKYLPPSDADI